MEVAVLLTVPGMNTGREETANGLPGKPNKVIVKHKSDGD
jgi:hypothetical protein